MDRWMEISSSAHGHTTYMMPIPGGALIRHIEKNTEHPSGFAVSFCFVPHPGDRATLNSTDFITASEGTVSEPRQAQR